MASQEAWGDWLSSWTGETKAGPLVTIQVRPGPSEVGKPGRSPCGAALSRGAEGLGRKL